MSKLTPKQKKFADEYIITGNATQSAIKAKYSKKYANTNASKLLQNTTIKSYIDERLEQLKKESIAEQDEVLQYLTSLLRGKEKEQALIGQGLGQQSIGDIDVSAKDRIKAAQLLGKRYDLWSGMNEKTSTEPITIVDEWSEDDE